MAQTKCKSKSGSNAKFWFKRNVTTKLGDYLVCNYKTQSDTLSIHLLRILDEAKQFEKLGLIGLADSNPGIFNWDLDFLFLIVFNYFDVDFYTAIFSKLQSIRL